MPNLKKIYSTMESEFFPDDLTINFGRENLVYKKRKWLIDEVEKGLRYGENPGQPAALYHLEKNTFQYDGIEWRAPDDAIISVLKSAQMLNAGKHPGKTNLTDVDNGINILQYLTCKSACVILKHNNPCGAAWATAAEGGITKAMQMAWQCDRIAAFGGAIVVNSPITIEAAQLISENYFEIIAAPAYEEGTLTLLRSRKNLRILELPALADLAPMTKSAYLEFKSLSDGGLIVQKSWQNAILRTDDFLPAMAETNSGLTVIAKRPTPEQLEDLLFAWAVEAGVASNSVIFAKNGATVAIGAGEQDRVGCVELAIFKAYSRYADWLAYSELGLSIYQLRNAAKTDPLCKEKFQEIEKRVKDANGRLKNSCLVSDGFFPFRDGVDVAIEQGISAIAQPGGSLRDAEVIQACNEAAPQVAMVFTGQRSFRH